MPEIEGAATEGTAIWLTDRSRINVGRTKCRRARYLEYHSGPFGYGIRRKSESLPLVTGAYVHDILAELLKAPQITDAQLRGMIGEAKEKYRKRCASRGYLELASSQESPEAAAELMRVIDEQTALIEALGWAAGTVWVPALLADYEPILIETEIELQVSDDIVLMNRPDAILRRRAGAGLVQVEFKTVGGYTDSPFWTKQWLHNAQLTLTKIATSAYLGEDVGTAYIFGIDKGRRSKEKATQLEKQWTPFLYAYHKAGNPPFEQEDWQMRWEWVDDTGASRRLGKAYKREATFTYNFGQPQGVSAVEYWVKSLPPEEIAAQRVILGPYQFLEHSQESILTGIVAEEREWVAVLWEIHQVGEKVGWQEDHPEFVRVLDEKVAQSWQCHQFGKDCQFLPICDRQPGWEKPLEGGRYEPRRPHHQPEIDQMKARGLELPPEQDEEEESSE